MTVCGLAAESVTVKFALIVPLSPSVTVTSLIVMSGLNPVLQSFTAEALLRGIADAMLKSEVLSFVSMHPPDFLNVAVALPGADVGLLPSKQLAVLPYPTRSTTPAGHWPLNAPAFETSATLPAPAVIEIVPIASGVGRFVVPPVP